MELYLRKSHKFKILKYPKRSTYKFIMKAKAFRSEIISDENSEESLNHDGFFFYSYRIRS